MPDMPGARHALPRPPLPRFGRLAVPPVSVRAILRSCQDHPGVVMPGRRSRRGREGWTGEHPLRPPFEPGNDMAVTHGAYSPARVAPEAERVLDELIPEGAPDYLRNPMFGPAVRLAATRVAQAERVARHVESLPMAEQMEPPKPGTSAPIEMSRKMDVAALGALATVGLTPVSAAKMTKALTGAQVDVAQLMAGIVEEDAAQD